MDNLQDVTPEQWSVAGSVLAAIFGFIAAHVRRRRSKKKKGGDDDD